MPIEIVAAVSFLMCTVIALIAAQWWRARQNSLELELMKRGAVATGKVVAINRPIGSPHETHVYFSFDPTGTRPVLRSCCVDMRALRQQHAVEFPAVGTQVSVRYLPEDPEHAVIAQLLPCLAGADTRHASRAP